ncbi:hypothetical protein B0J11DRAFT_596964 [Dendryphion nanum]|uniref:Uncharacterized protein n=1 Tax=Dendryphion nanum TaxID=256645 RepID=A0A9P9IW28_9PLEO|nr:hypothetical protein B0J11DRAFT_596964 [Dendryphion nanum]
MVLSVLVAIIAAPALLGTQEAIRQSQAKEKREEHRARRCNLIATCVKSSMRSREINGRPLVLKNGKIYIDTGTGDGAPYGHPLAGYYLPYPDTKYEGLVTTITDVAPIMNWIYIDKETYELKYGVRVDAQPNLTGPFDCTRQDRRLTFDGWEGWCAVEEFPTLWAIYCDLDDNGLQTKVPEGTRVLEVELSRKEKRWKKEAVPRQEDQTTKREVNAQEDAPTDKPVTIQPQLNPPGVVQQASAAPKPFSLPKTIFPESAPPLLAGMRPRTPPPAYSATNSSITPQPKPQPQTPSPDKSTNPRLSPSSEKRVPVTTPKLNRNSGTRTLAQAQMFEAMSRKMNEIPLRNANPASRPISNADSTSDYSDQSTSFDIPQPYPPRPESDALPQPSDPIVSPKPLFLDKRSATVAPDPAIFGNLDEKSSSNATKAVRSASNPRSIERSGARRNGSFSETLPSQPPKGSLPPLPALLSNRQTSQNRLRQGSKSPDQPRSVSNERARAYSSERQPVVSKQLSRSLSRTLRESPGMRSQSSTNQLRQRERGASTSSREEDKRSSPRPLARTNTTPGSARKTMATTMTTGSKTSMYRQMVPPSADPPNKERTNSSLYREIDDILKPSSSRARAARDGQTRRDDRPPPLRRAATSQATAGSRDNARRSSRDGGSNSNPKPPGVF